MTNAATFEDTFNLLCGDKIGEGIHRTVYECSLRPDLVVKVENSNLRYFANVLEMTFWNDHSAYKAVSRWLAPCKYLSPDGRVMLQQRVDPLPIGKSLPDRLPAFLTDHKKENFGVLNGKVVCVDYAMTITNPSTRLTKVHW